MTNKQRRPLSSYVLIGLSFLLLTYAASEALANRREHAPRQLSESDWSELASGGHLRGGKGNVVTVVEIGDYQCAACAAFQSTIEQLLQEFGSEIELRYRHYPIVELNPYSVAYANAGECAAEQNVFVDYHRALYSLVHERTEVDLLTLAESVGISDREQFGRCVENFQHQARLVEDVMIARRIGVLGTPTLVVNGTTISGNRPYRQVRKLVREAIRAAE
jgi:protein-disulfide isomerase